MEGGTPGKNPAIIVTDASYSQDSYILLRFSEWYAYPCPIHITQYFKSWLTTHQLWYIFCHYQLQHLLPYILVSGTCYLPLSIFPLKMTLNPWKQASHISCSTSSNFEERLNKSGHHTNAARMKTENLYRETGTVYFYFIKYQYFLIIFRFNHFHVTFYTD